MDAVVIIVLVIVLIVVLIALFAAVTYLFLSIFRRPAGAQAAKALKGDKGKNDDDGGK